MTIWRTGWGPVNVLLVRRQDGLAKMLGFSCLFHLFLFVFLILNNVLFGLSTPSFSGFQVSLIAPGKGLSGFGGSGSGSGGGSLVSVKPSPKSGARKARKAVVSKRRAAVKSSKKTRSVKPEKAAPASRPKAATRREAKPVASKKARRGKRMSDLAPSPQSPRKAVARAKPPVVAARSKGRGRLGKADPPSRRDPERLADWWRKQKKSLKLPATGSLVNAKKIPIPQTRTAKIDIKRPAIVLPPPVSAPGLEESPAQEGRAAQSEDAQNAPVSQPDSNPASSDLGSDGKNSVNPSLHQEGNEASPGDVGGDAGSQSTGKLSLQASVGPGIKGIGTGTGSGGGSFFFSSYLQKIDSKIRWHWAPPPMRPGEDSLVVQFVINKDGGIDKGSVEVKESSGNIFFDQAALRAVFAAHPLPPLPKAYTEDRLIIYMNFIVKEDT